MSGYEFDGPDCDYEEGDDIECGPGACVGWLGSAVVLC